MAEEGGCTCHRRDTRTLHAPDKAQQEDRGAQSVRGGGTRLARRMTVRGPEACVRVLVILVFPHGPAVRRRCSVGCWLDIGCGAEMYERCHGKG